MCASDNPGLGQSFQHASLYIGDVNNTDKLSHC